MDPRHDKMCHPGQTCSRQHLSQAQKQELLIQMAMGVDQPGPIFGLQNLLIGIHCHRP